MSEKPTIIEYTHLDSLLSDTKSPDHPAQLHGFICGLISGSATDSPPSFKKELPGLYKHSAIRPVLQQLYEYSFRQLNQFYLEFELLLPDDDTAIVARSEALGLWCQGFLSGLQREVNVRSLPEGELKDILSDLVEIAQVSFDDLEEDDENETAYTELVEYVRLSVLMVYQELHPHAKAEETDDFDA